MASEEIENGELKMKNEKFHILHSQFSILNSPLSLLSRLIKNRLSGRCADARDAERFDG
jgi:hypothetical protein